MQAVQQILPETLLAYRLLQIFVGGGNDTYIETSVRLVAYGTVLPFLYGTKQQLLRFQRQIAYLVQKQRTAICLVEISLRSGVCTRKCTLDMPEKCRRGKLDGERAAIHRHEGLAGTLAFFMQVMGYMLLARTVLAEYQHAHLGRGNQLYPLHDGSESRTVTGEHGHVPLSAVLFFLNVAEQRDKLVLDQQLGDVVQRTELHALHGGMHLGIVGHDDERQCQSFFPHPPQQVYSVSVRQAQVGKHYIPAGGLLQEFPRRYKAVSLHGAESLPCQQVADKLAIHDVVLYHDDCYLILDHTSSFPLSPAG